MGSLVLDQKPLEQGVLMSLWTAITGIFSTPVAAATAGTDLLKQGASAIDAVFYTDQEKDQARKEWFAMVLESEKANQEQGQIRSVTRRVLARDFTRVYIFLILAAVVLYPLDKEWTAFILRLVEIVSYAVVPVVVFFFGSYGWGTYIKKS